MQALLHKEYLVNRQVILMTVIILIVGGFIMADSFQIPMLLPLIFGALQPFSNAKNEDLSRSDILINSLPTTRKKIVLSKYIFSIIIVFFYFSLVYVINFVMPIYEPNTLNETLLSGMSVVLFLALYYPLFYLLGPRFLTVGMTVLAFLVLAVVFPLINIGARNKYWGIETYVNSLSELQVVTTILIISVTVITVSYFLSGSIYKKKDF